MSNLILAVDDDPMVHRLLGFALKDEPYELEMLPGAVEAQQFLKVHHRKVDAIILDWEMPVMDGIEFLHWQKGEEQYKDIPVIMLTGHNKKSHIKQGIDAGAHYYLIKPFNKDLLTSIINSAINDYTIMRELSKQVRVAKNPLENLHEGYFRIRTFEDAQQLSILIANTTKSPDENLIICELLNNAVEHGNLGISYEDKSALIAEGTLNEEIARRLQLPENVNKYADITFKRNDKHLDIRIEDKGDGFDFNKYLQFDEERVFDSHGRGIAMANTILNVKYEGKGNVVNVHIPLNGESLQ